MSFALIDAKRAEVPIETACVVLNVSASGFYAWKNRGASPRQHRDMIVLAHIRAEFSTSLARDQDWKLSPAYDLTPANPISEEHRDLAMACGDQGRWANAGNLLSQSARFLLRADEANSIVDEVENVVKIGWYRTLRDEGVSERDAETLKGAFAYPGFRLVPGASPAETERAQSTAPSAASKPAPRKS